ncbi:MAG: polysaccharide biosynthesis/export family protein [Nannocystaceae bacterium]|nr:polysaccharide biosynthesis/export family protein [Nannocystaceae bacterium]
MRAQSLWSIVVLVGIGCHPDPLSTALSVPGRTQPVPHALVAGDEVAVDMLRPKLRSRTTVAQSGTLAVPLCGDVQVAGLTASQACSVVAQCLGTYVRHAAVRVTVGQDANAADQAGCDISGPTLPKGWASESMRVLDAAGQADRAEPLVLARAIEAAASLERLRIERTAQHPEVKAMRARVTALMDASAAPTQSKSAATVRTKISPLLAQAQQTHGELAGSLGPDHPDLRVATATVEYVGAAMAALPAGETALAATQHDVEATRLTAHIEFLQTHAPPDDATLLELRSQLASLPEPSSPPASCTDRVRALDVGIAFEEGRRAAGADRMALDAILDALAVARARLLADPGCR